MGDSEAAAAAANAKLDGNEALKSADLPRAIELYEKAVQLVDKAIDEVPQEGALRNNQLVRYADGRYAIIDTAYPQFEDYVIMDLYNRDIVRHKVGRHDFDVVSKRFMREELHSVPQELFDLKVACLQNIALATLKMAKGTKRASDFEEAVKRANDALALDGKSPKALMRKGQALVDLRDWQNAFQCLAVASQETKGKDPEVQRLLQTVMVMKGKGKGNPGPRYGKGKGGLPFCPCKDPKCEDGTKCYEKAQAEAAARANPPPPPPIEEEESHSEDEPDTEILKRIRESEWKPVDVPPPPDPPKPSTGAGLRTSIREMAPEPKKAQEKHGSSSSSNSSNSDDEGNLKIEEIDSEQERMLAAEKKKKQEMEKKVKEEEMKEEEKRRKRQEKEQEKESQQQKQQTQQEEQQKQPEKAKRREEDDEEDEEVQEQLEEPSAREGKSILRNENLPMIGMWLGAVSMAISMAMFLMPVLLHYNKGGNEDIEL